MGISAEVLQYRPFRRMFPPAGAGRMFTDTRCYMPTRVRALCGTPWLRPHPDVLTPSAAAAAAEEAAEII
ncbi:hypothetical protein C2L64_11775 [Paraburkholderia hospita]|uniref:Uncharacterized protein n=1 Tax=Paraburkholderia hospita TaxID=169430 RepID=A0AAN1J821_9BURK|nr:hypothetical protein C2L64_11775 [Paraburkholderia hospita]